MEDKKVLVALSGGADSVYALLWCKEQFTHVEAAHVNYGLRGEESDQEEEYCKTLCEKWNIPLHIRKATREEQIGGNQESYRELRYIFFSQVVNERGLAEVVTGHHQNDQAETIFYHLIKGAGLEGASGMKEYETLYGVCVYRPFRLMKKEEMIAELNQKGVQYKTDSSNLTTKYARNKIRLDVFPSLEQAFQVDVVASLGRFGQIMGELEDMMDQEVDEIRKACCEETEEGVRMDVTLLRKHHPAKQKYLFLQVLKKRASEIKHVHIEQMAALMQAKSGMTLSLPGGIRAEKQRHHVIIRTPSTRSPKKYVLSEEEKVEIKELGLSVMWKEVKTEEPGVCVYVSGKPTSIEVAPYEEGSTIYYTAEKRKKIKKIIREKSSYALQDVWYIKINDEVVYIPQFFYQTKRKKREGDTIIKLFFEKL